MWGRMSCPTSLRSMKSDRVYLEQILDATEKIRQFVSDMDQDAFLKEPKDAKRGHHAIGARLRNALRRRPEWQSRSRGGKSPGSATAPSMTTIRLISKSHGARFSTTSNRLP